MDREEAIKIVRNIYQTDAEKEALGTLIPELKESEDERIRKAIFKALSKKDARDVLLAEGVQVSEALAYLEKQKEHSISAVEVLARTGLKPYKDGNQWCILAGDNIQEGICGFGDTIEDALYEFLKEILDLQKEQKPLSPDERMNHPLYLEGFYVGREVGKVEADRKPAWSEEDKKMPQSILRDYECPMQSSRAIWGEDFKKKYNWLKSLRPPLKLSEDQIYTLERICSNLHLRASDDAPKLDEIIEQLKQK